MLIVVDDMNNADWQILRKTKDLLQAVYPNFFLTDPSCCPSRASILTGRYPHNHGTLHNGGDQGGWESFVDQERSAIGGVLRHSGYQTALLGKYLNRYDPEAGRSPGWDLWFAKAGGGYFGYQVAIDNRVKTYGEREQDYSVDVIKRKTVDFIADSPNTAPLFAYVAPNANHNPFTPAPRFVGDCQGMKVPRPENFDAEPTEKPPYLSRSALSKEAIAKLNELERARLCTLKSVDDLVTAVIAALERRGRPYNVIFVSDNGYLMGNHRRVGKGVPYEEAVRVTMRATGPDFVAGMHDDLVANIDLAPTLAALGGASMSNRDGFDFLHNKRTVLLLENFGAGASSFAEEEPRASARIDVETAQAGGRPTWRVVRTADAVYIETEVDGGEPFQELYELSDDVAQLDNLADTGDPRIATYEAALRKLEDCSGGACNTVEIEPNPVTTEKNRSEKNR